MARLARLVLPGAPHHIIQRVNRREQTFFEDDDYALYLDLLAQAVEQAHTEIWSYCLMPNHVHIIGVPSDGRLKKSTKTGGPTNGQQTTTTYDPAGNRSNQTTAGAPPTQPPPPPAPPP